MSVFVSSVKSLSVGGRKQFLGHLRILQQQSHPRHTNYCIRDNSSIKTKNSDSNSNSNHRCKRLPPTALSFSSSSSEAGNSNKEESSSTLGTTKKIHPNPTKIIVVGAGISGLSVAYHLAKLASSPLLSLSESKKFDIEILEVRHRIGGRIRPFNIDGDGDGEHNGEHDGDGVAPTWIDLGGQWLHESSPENPIRRLLEDDLNIGFVGNDDDNDCTDVGGKKKTTKTKSNRFHEKRVRNVLFDQDGTRMDKGIVQRARNVFYKAMGDGDDFDNGEDLDGNRYNIFQQQHGTTDRNAVSFRDLLDVRTAIELNSDNRLKGSVLPPALSFSISPDSASSSNLQLQSFDRAMNYFVHRSEEHEGGKLHEVSAFLANTLYEGTGESPDRVVKGSYRSLLEALSSHLGLKENSCTKNVNQSNVSCSNNDDDDEDEEHRCKVRLRSNARVERIEYGGDERISLSVMENETTSADANDCGNDNSNNSYHPTAAAAAAAADSTAVTSVLECDYCVCTVPLGVLQQRKIEFVPPLPPKRQEAIDGIGMGLLNKIVFRFDFEKKGDNEDSYKFWGNLKQFGICHEDPALIKTYYDCTDDYYEEDQGAKIFSSAILVQFLAGSAADRIDPPLPPIAEMDHDQSVASGGGGLTDEEAIHESLQALRSVFGSENVPKPSISKVTRWRNDPWSCGSYSFTKVGSSPGMYDEIASPLGSSSSNDRLLFAGEHTSKHCHSTVHGAWETGVREAERIFERVQHKNDR
jgi:hypothetical protein